MTAVQHFASVSGGKDSLVTAIRAIKRFERRPPDNFPPRFLACDTGNEHEGWRDYIAYLDHALGVRIEVLRADFTRQLEMRRINIRKDWSREKRLRYHTTECRARQGTMPFRERKALCRCPEHVLPALPDAVIDEAITLLVPSGNPFLDLYMLKGRFPGLKARFCTDELKIMPMMAIKQPLLDAGFHIVEWIGERAQESRDRARKPVVQRIRHASGASQILYRPIHGLKVEQVFAEIAEAGLLPNPLYAAGASRVGCWPCILCGKNEVSLVARMTPHEIERLRAWEALVGRVSRRRMATFFCAKMVPGDPSDEARAQIDKVVAWAGTSRGGRQFDMFQTHALAEQRSRACDRDLAVCE